MAGRDRLELLGYYGMAAWQGLKALMAGIDVVIDPNESLAPWAGAENAAPARVEAPGGDLCEALPVTLAVYPGAGALLAEEALGVTGRPLPVDGDPEVEATARDLAWLPLRTGLQVYARVAGGRLVAVGGYRRAGLVRFEAAAARVVGTWCALGEDALSVRLPRALRDGIVQEEPGKLLAAMAQRQVQMAVLGGPALGAALAIPDAELMVELEPAPRLGIIPVWGLFAACRAPALAPVDHGDVALVPVAAAEAHQELTGAVVR